MSEAHVSIKRQRWVNVQSIFWADGLDWMWTSSMEAPLLFHRHVSVARPKQRRYEQTTQSAIGVNRCMDSTLDDMEGYLFEAKVFKLQFWGGPYVYMNELLAFSCLLRHSSSRRMLFCMIDVFLSFSSNLCWIPQYSSCNDRSFVFLLNIWNKFGGQCSYIYLV